MTSDTPHDADILISGGTIVAFDGTAHRRLEDGVVAIKGNEIVHVGRRWDGAATRRIDAAGKIVIPGQISTHAHIGAHEGPRLLIDAGRRQFLRSGFLHFLPARRAGGPGFYARAGCARLAALRLCDAACGTASRPCSPSGRAARTAARP